MLYDLLLVYNFDCVHHLGYFVAHLVHFPKPTHADVRVCERFEVVATALALLAGHHGRGQEEDARLDSVDFTFELWGHFHGHQGLGHLFKYEERHSPLPAQIRDPHPRLLQLQVSVGPVQTARLPDVRQTSRPLGRLPQQNPAAPRNI